MSFRQGAVSFRGVVALLFVVTVGFTAWRATLAYLRHQEMIADLRSLTEDALLKNGEGLRAKITSRMHEVDPNFDDKALQVDFKNGNETVFVNFSYQRPVDVTLASLPLPLEVDFVISRRQEAATVRNVVNAFDNASKATEDRMKKQADVQ